MAARLSIGMLVLLAALAEPADAQEQFVVIHVEPQVPDITAGAIFESEPGSPEFIFVPSGVKAVLLGEDGERYLIEGRTAAVTNRAGLAEFRVPRPDEGRDGLAELVLGTTGLAEITAASRKIPGRREEAASDDTAAARSPLFIELLDKVAKGAFCLADDSIVLRRLDTRFLDRYSIEIGDRVLEEDLAPGRLSVRFVGLGIGEGEKARIKVATKLSQQEITAVRLPGAVASMDGFAKAAALADRDCTIQALLESGQLSSQD